VVIVFFVFFPETMEFDASKIAKEATSKG